eukprot:403350267
MPHQSSIQPNQYCAKIENNLQKNNQTFKNLHTVRTRPNNFYGDFQNADFINERPIPLTKSAKKERQKSARKVDKIKQGLSIKVMPNQIYEDFEDSNEIQDYEQLRNLNNHNPLYSHKNHQIINDQSSIDNRKQSVKKSTSRIYNDPRLPQRNIEIQISNQNESVDDQKVDNELETFEDKSSSSEFDEQDYQEYLRFKTIKPQNNLSLNSLQQINQNSKTRKMSVNIQSLTGATTFEREVVDPSINNKENSKKQIAVQISMIKI